MIFKIITWPAFMFIRAMHAFVVAWEDAWYWHVDNYWRKQ